MIVIYNARIYTLDPQEPLATAVAINGGKILALGEDNAFLSSFGGTAGVTLFNAGGRAVIPGLTDAHIHLELYALGLKKVDCETSTRQDCLRRVADRAENTPAGEWILGHGWNQNNWPEGFGCAADLDQAAPHHPVYLTAKSLHAGWANEPALHLANITHETPDPAGGRIQRDERGEPTGILFEAAMELLAAAIPEPRDEAVSQAIREAQAELWQMGLTGLHDFDRRRCFSALQALHLNGELRLRVIKSIPLDDLPFAVALGLRSGFGDDFLRIGGVKAFADGALGPRTAAMLQPYEGEPDNRGMLLLDAEELYERGRLAVENGLNLCVHAIGDLAVHEVLNAYAQLINYERRLTGAVSPTQPLRHRIEHVQLIHPDDAGRLAELGIIASMQPVHAPSDMEMANRYWGRRAALSYAWRTQLAQGAVLAFGSDAPVESPNPFWGLHAAVTRRRADGAPGAEGWYPDQKLHIEEALRAYTRGPAYAAGLETRSGKLTPGYLADLLVLDTDPFLCDPEELRSTRPVATMVGGEWVWKNIP